MSDPRNPLRAERLSHPHRRAVIAVVGAVLLVVSALGSTLGAQAEPVPPPGVSISLNGRPMGGEGGKLSGCVLSVDVAGLELDADPATEIAVTVDAMGPTVPEGTDATLVDDTATTTATTWDRAYDMTALVEPYEPKPNGYHLRVRVAINGVTAGEATVWLGCGAAQTGSPSRLVFAVAWQAADGTVLPAPPVGLPPGWEAAFGLDASVSMGPRGTARCTYAPGSGLLTCEYDNPGHGGGKPGLVLPGNPRAEYTVAVEGAPTGWAVDPATIGTFLGRDTCPRGGDEGGHEGGHEGEVSTAAAEEGGHGEGGHGGCTHTVLLVEEPPAPPDDEPAPPPTPGPETLGAGAAAQPVTASARFTG
ncbi:MAG: hypothetical protein MUE36_14495 [Acidimicrobiales bacterium]|jgi:hypothetical protein|nr:hypothetical protein [Acidimicrobiales bacterium]